ncbi:hypothetical protein BJX65DRAFT_97320 [Aspergillus insuetus]
MQPDSQILDVPDNAARVLPNLKSFKNLKLSTFIGMLNDMEVGHYLIQVTLFEKRPLVFKSGRIAVLILALGLQIGFSLVAL